MEDFIQLPEESIKNQLRVSFNQQDSVLPFTLGTVFRPDQEVIFFDDYESIKIWNIDYEIFLFIQVMPNRVIRRKFK